MRAIINGTRYDTDRATLLAEATPPGVARNEMQFYEAGLYRTPRSRRYFVAGWGGAMTVFAHSLPTGGFTGGQRIIPLSEQQAFEWAQEHLDDDLVEEHFGHLIEDA